MISPPPINIQPPLEENDRAGSSPPNEEQEGKYATEGLSSTGGRKSARGTHTVLGRVQATSLDTDTPHMTSAGTERYHGSRNSRGTDTDDEGDDGGFDEGDDYNDDDGDEPWVVWFCALRGNEFFCDVPIEWISDMFNLHGLRRYVPQFFDYALDMLLDLDTDENTADLTEEEKEMVDTSAEKLYGLIHARFIVTSHGLQQMHKKYMRADFGRCHRVFCEGQPVLPLGHSDIPDNGTVVLYCPKCREIYFPKSHRRGNLDGAYWGSTFASLFFMTYPELVPAPSEDAYVPRVFGFKVHTSSKFWSHNAVEEGPRPSVALTKKERRKMRRQRAEQYFR